MNRREFLTTLGVGALSLAGKFPPPRPTFCVEIEVDGSAIWVNGKRPDKAWSHGFGLDRLDSEMKNLVVDGVKITSIRATNSNECRPGSGTEVEMETSKGLFRGQVIKVVDQTWAQNGDVKPMKVELYNKETLELNSGQKFFRIDF